MSKTFKKISDSFMLRRQIKVFVVWDGRDLYWRAFQKMVERYDGMADKSFHWGGARLLSSSSPAKRETVLRDIREAMKTGGVKTVILMVPVFEEDIDDAVRRLKIGEKVTRRDLEYFAKSIVQDDEAFSRNGTKLESIVLVYVKPDGIYREVKS